MQKQIYQGVGGSKEYNWDDYKKFADKVGWRKGGEWLSYSRLTFSEKHNTGHLPRLWGEKEVWEGKGGRHGPNRRSLREHFSLMWRPVNCNI